MGWGISRQKSKRIEAKQGANSAVNWLDMFVEGLVVVIDPAIVNCVTGSGLDSVS
jgi:hypothetical protein